MDDEAVDKLSATITDAIKRVAPRVPDLRETAKTHPVEAAWESYAALCLNGAPEPVLDSMRMTFFAGALAVFQKLCNTVDMSRPFDEPTDAEMAGVEAIGAELEEYKNDMLRAALMATSPEGRS